MGNDKNLDKILAQNPYRAEIEAEEEKLKNLRRNANFFDKAGEHDVLFRQEDECESRKQVAQAQAANWDYEQTLKYHHLTPIWVPPYVMKDVKPILKEAYQYAPNGASIKIRVHNRQEPFKRPEIRFEILGVLDGKETVRARFNYSMDEGFSHTVFDKPRAFTYVPDRSLESVAPFMVMKLPELSFGTGERYSGRIGAEIVEVLREKGYYLFVPFIIDDE